MTGSLSIKGGKYYAILNFKDKTGKRVKKWINLNLEAKGNKRAAEKCLQELINEYEGRDNVVPSKKLFCDYLKEWVESRRGFIADTTVDGYETMLNKHVYPYFLEKKITLEKINSDDVERYYQYLMGKGLSNNTVIKHHAMMRTCLEKARKQKLIFENSCDLAEKPKRTRYFANYYDFNEINKLLGVSKNHPLHAPILFSALFGLRRSEVLGLMWSNIDLNKNIMHIRHSVVRTITGGKVVDKSKNVMKNNSSYRSFPLNEQVVNYLQSLKQQQELNYKNNKPNYNTEFLDYVCVDELGKRISADYCTKGFGKIINKYNLRKIRFHDLRHSSATMLLELGYNMKLIQHWLGHATFEQTANTYAHVNVESKKDMVEDFSAKLNF